MNKGNQMKKTILFIATLLLSLSSCLGTVGADETAYNNIAKHAIAIEARTGKILYEKDSHKPSGIGSTTKIITAFLVLEAVKRGDLQMGTKVNVSDYAYELSTSTSSSEVPLDDREYTVEQLMDAMLLNSSNGASVALAEKVAGSERKFVDQMRALLKSWDINDGKIVNASGLNNVALGDRRYPKSKEDDENLLSAYDLAVITKHILDEHPEMIDITEKASADFAGKTITNTNLMIEGLARNRAGVDGLKTGSSGEYGDSFVVTGNERGMRLITVVLGVDTTEDINARFVAAASLMNYINQTYFANVLAKEGDAYENSKSLVINGKKEKVAAVAAEDAYFIQRRDNPNEPKATFTYDKKGYQAPIKKGQAVGYLTYEDPDKVGEGYLGGQKPQFPFVAGEKVERSFFLRVWWNEFVRYVNENL